ncbi:translocation protein TolB [Halolamina pelagica]|uniref:Translocation protein TolB n=1 Tax=Halolamina pelagica TaxID=699431 RepID=A0A0P7G8G1_9EURY|nr:hypothetical protein [Halolamina pelagica]KPN29559.1 translocation protein TolB [Halolamina pelagica]
MQYGVARYIGIDSTDTPTFTPGGDLAYLADTTGTPQVYRLDEPDSYPERLTAHDERVSFVDASPTRDELLFGMDEGSNERDQLYRYDLETGEEQQLTDEPEAKHLWGGWGPEGDRFAFAANRRQGDTFDVYVQGRDSEGADLVWEGPGGFVGVAAWHPDGDALILQESNSSSDVVLYWLDIDTGAAERLTDTGEEARYHHVAFGPDGDLYTVTDYGAETAYVGRIDTDARGGGGVDSVETIEQGPEEWNVDSLQIDADSGRAAYTLNVDGYSETYLGELSADGSAIVDTVEPELPDGVVAGVELGPDGERAAIEFSADDHPHSIYVAGTGSAAKGAADADAGSGDTERFTTPGRSASRRTGSCARRRSATRRSTGGRSRRTGRCPTA